MRTGPNQAAPARRASGQAPGRGRRRCREGLRLLGAEVVPLDPAHERLALLYLAELLAPLLGTDGPARRAGHSRP
jgi:hypothetical protein